MQTIEGRQYASIQDGRVTWLFVHADLPEYNEDHLEVVDITLEDPVPQVGWEYSNGAFAAPVTTFEQRASSISARRYVAETSGVIVQGAAVPTDRESQAMVTGAALAATLDSGYQCQWKTASGFVTLDAQAIIAMASAMRAHVQACFDREAELLAALEAGTFTEAMLDEGWPV